MTDNSYTWLPSIINYDGDWDVFLELIYDVFKADFIFEQPRFGRFDVRSERHTAYEGKDHSFWHCIEEKTDDEPTSEENRIPKIRLCERVPWMKPLIENCLSCDGVLVWREIYTGRGTHKRVHIFLTVYDYVIVLDPRKIDEKKGSGYYFLWTTFICESDRRREELFRRYKKSEKIL